MISRKSKKSNKSQKTKFIHTLQSLTNNFTNNGNNYKTNNENSNNINNITNTYNISNNYNIASNDHQFMIGSNVNNLNNTNSPSGVVNGAGTTGALTGGRINSSALGLYTKNSLSNRVNSMCSQNPGMKAFQASILNQQMYASQSNLNNNNNPGHITGSRTNLNAQNDKTYKSKANSQASKMGPGAGNMSTTSRTGITLAGNYKLFYKIGSGSFGEIYLALNLKTNQEVAVKVEPMSSRPQSLPYEAKVYQRIQSGEGIPKVHYFGAERSRDLHVLVMDLLGPSLEDLFKFCGRKLSYKTTIMLADQMISRVEWLHSKNLIHRDIKPDNFMMGIGANCNTVFLADYGLAKRYRNSVGKHIKYRDDKSLTGTARYASVNTHYGSEQSRRDDLESLGYVLVYFMKGKLPWQNLKNKDRTKNRYEAIAEKKLTTSIPTLCYGCPAEFQMFLQYCRGLKFDESPDYNYLRQLFQVLLNSMGYEMDNVYDWTNIMDQAMKKKENSISSGYASSESQEKKIGSKNNNKPYGVGHLPNPNGAAGISMLDAVSGRPNLDHSISQIGLSGTASNLQQASNLGGTSNKNQFNNNNDYNYDTRKSCGGASKSAYKETSSKGWLRFPFTALRFTRNKTTKSIRGNNDGYTEKSYGKNCKASVRTGLTDRRDLHIMHSTSMIAGNNCPGPGAMTTGGATHQSHHNGLNNLGTNKGEEKEYNISTTNKDLHSPLSIGRQKSCRSTNVDNQSKGILRGKMRRSFFLMGSSSKKTTSKSAHSVKNHF